MSSASGSGTCENCGKRVLPTDTLCWHCGWKLPQRTAPVDLTLNPTVRETAVAEAAPPTDFNLRAIAISGALTLLLIVALLLVMRALGQRPLLVSSAGREMGDDWVQLTDSQLRYTMGIPSGWQWLDVPFRDQQAVLADVLARQPAIGRSLNSLGDLAGDAIIEGVGLDTPALQLPDPVPFVVVATSAQLHQLEPQAILDAMASSGSIVIEPHIDTSVPLQPQARFGVFNEALGFQCQHLVVANRDLAAADQIAYLVSACAPQSQFAAIQRELETVLSSFQLIQQ